MQHKGIIMNVISFASSKYLLAFSDDAPFVPIINMPKNAKYASSSIYITKLHDLACATKLQVFTKLPNQTIFPLVVYQ